MTGVSTNCPMIELFTATPPHCLETVLHYQMMMILMELVLLLVIPLEPCTDEVCVCVLWLITRYLLSALLRMMEMMMVVVVVKRLYTAAAAARLAW